MIENNNLNRDLLKLSFLQRVESIPRSKLGLDDFIPSDDELHTILQKHSENITLLEVLEHQVYLVNTTSSDIYQSITLGFMYKLFIARKCKELYEKNFYCVYPIPNLD
ncbi:hypothetical protein [Campylobacter devanensis]|uniref:hypothetical protein n=1 Tax=Campylobacter devanensis TaxID=3161138 RepID=UPI000A33436C|nr:MULTISPECIES: hypothetical protein [unclassified Campylobacter]